jgi:hypothetical protein
MNILKKKLKKVKKYFEIIIIFNLKLEIEGQKPYI